MKASDLVVGILFLGNDQGKEQFRTVMAIFFTSLIDHSTYPVQDVEHPFLTSRFLGSLITLLNF